MSITSSLARPACLKTRAAATVAGTYWRNRYDALRQRDTSKRMYLQRDTIALLQAVDAWGEFTKDI